MLKRNLISSQRKKDMDRKTRIMADFLLERVEVRREWGSVFNGTEEGNKSCQP